MAANPVEIVGERFPEIEAVISFGLGVVALGIVFREGVAVDRDVTFGGVENLVALRAEHRRAFVKRRKVELGNPPHRAGEINLHGSFPFHRKCDSTLSTYARPTALYSVRSEARGGARAGGAPLVPRRSLGREVATSEPRGRA